MLYKHLFTPSLAHPCNLLNSLGDEGLLSLFQDIFRKFKIKQHFMRGEECYLFGI